MADTTDYSMADDADVEEASHLRAELDRLHSWAGLLELLDEHWPQDVFSPDAASNEAADPGVRIVALIRWVNRLQGELDLIHDAERSTSRSLAEDVRRLTAERLEVEDACTEYANSCEHGGDLPDVVADMWDRIKRLERIVSERYLEVQRLTAERDALAADVERLRGRTHEIQAQEMAKRAALDAEVVAWRARWEQAERWTVHVGLTADWAIDPSLPFWSMTSEATRTALMRLVAQRDDLAAMRQRVLDLADRQERWRGEGWLLEASGRHMAEALRQVPSLIRAAVDSPTVHSGLSGEPGPAKGRIYLAARYSRNAEMRDVRAYLVAAGYEVTSRWIDCHADVVGDYTASFTTEFLNASPQLSAPLGQHDLDDLAAADIVMSFTCGTGGKGGRHVEFGVGIGLGKRLIVVGPREHVFHTLARVEHYDELPSALAALHVLVEPATPDAVTTEAEAWRVFRDEAGLIDDPDVIFKAPEVLLEMARDRARQVGDRAAWDRIEKAARVFWPDAVTTEECPECGHEHAGPELAGICIGCPCPVTIEEAT